LKNNKEIIMEVLPILNLPTTHEAVVQAATQLGDLLREHPQYQAYMQSIINLQNDPKVKELSLKLQQTRNAVYGGKNTPELSAEMERLSLELENLPVIQAYRAAESDARELLSAVNALLSEALKVDFAANAKRGCGCGG
jgi:cell fate (sporulation/competence/biofilm development) regulator YlbF (YheA/YmcA/DUF963 family)